MTIRYRNFKFEFKRNDFFLFSPNFKIEFRRSGKKQIQKFATIQTILHVFGGCDDNLQKKCFEEYYEGNYHYLLVHKLSK